MQGWTINIILSGADTPVICIRGAVKNEIIAEVRINIPAEVGTVLSGLFSRVQKSPNPDAQFGSNLFSNFIIYIGLQIQTQKPTII